MFWRRRKDELSMWKKLSKVTTPAGQTDRQTRSNSLLCGRGGWGRAWTCVLVQDSMGRVPEWDGSWEWRLGQWRWQLHTSVGRTHHNSKLTGLEWHQDTLDRTHRNKARTCWTSAVSPSAEPAVQINHAVLDHSTEYLAVQTSTGVQQYTSRLVLPWQ